MKEALTSAPSSLNVGSGLDPAVQIGPLVDRCSRDRVAQRIEEACASAEEILLAFMIPGKNLAKGAFLAPALVRHEDANASFAKRKSSAHLWYWKAS